MLFLQGVGEFKKMTWTYPDILHRQVQVKLLYIWQLKFTQTGLNWAKHLLLRWLKNLETTYLCLLFQCSTFPGTGLSSCPNLFLSTLYSIRKQAHPEVNAFFCCCACPQSFFCCKYYERLAAYFLGCGWWGGGQSGEIRSCYRVNSSSCSQKKTSNFLVPLFPALFIFSYLLVQPPQESQNGVLYFLYSFSYRALLMWHRHNSWTPLLSSSSLSDHELWLCVSALPAAYFHNQTSFSTHRWGFPVKLRSRAFVV